MLKFNGFNIFVKQLRTDKGFRIEIDTDLSQYDLIKDIPKLPDGIYEITIKPIVESVEKNSSFRMKDFVEDEV